MTLVIKAFIPLIVSSMNLVLPEEKLTKLHKNIDWHETYETFAEQALEYSFGKKPLTATDLDGDGTISDDEYKLGQFYTAALFTSIAYHESRFLWKLKDMDGDNGASVCAMQINEGNTFRQKSGWTGVEIKKDMDKCLTLAYKTLDWSFGKGKSGDTITMKLTGYASGKYGVGTEAAFNRCHTFVKIINHVVAEGEKGNLTLPIKIKTLNQNKWCGTK